MLGKELRDAQTNIWLNYAMPIDQLRDAILSGLRTAFDEQDFARICREIDT